MRPGVTVVLATFWLVTCVNSKVALESLDPYQKLYDQKTPESSVPSNFDIDSQEQSTGYQESNSLVHHSGSEAGFNFSPLVEAKEAGNLAGRGFTDEKADDDVTKEAESALRELSSPSEAEDPFVADDTFQDQGPGSVETYKLDLLIGKILLDPPLVTRLPSMGKSKVPKKTGHANWNAKTAEDNRVTEVLDQLLASRMSHKQSNTFDDSSTEVLSPQTDPFGVGGVPELQVGCEGMAADSRYNPPTVELPGKSRSPRGAGRWTNITPVSLDYELPEEEDSYEEMDELLKLKKLETTTKRAKQNRGDMEATLHSDFHGDKIQDEQLPVRGDLGNSSLSNQSSVVPAAFGNRRPEERMPDRRTSYYDQGRSRVNQGRRLLWLDELEKLDEQDEEHERKKRGTWGFGEDEGVVSSDELQTENQRRRLAYEGRKKEEEERWRQQEEQRRQEEARRRNYLENRTNSDIEKIREEYERSLDERRREEDERQRRLQQEAQRPSRWQLEEEQRRRSHEEELRRNRWQQERTDTRRNQSGARIPVHEEDTEMLRRRVEDARRRLRLREEERQQRLREEEENRRKETNRWEEEMNRRQQELDRRNLEERRRQWMLKRKQEAEEEEERRRQQSRNEPSNLMHPSRGRNESRPYDIETERRLREQQERERQRKLNEYIQRNRPVNLDGSTDRQREEASRRRQEEEASRRRQEEEASRRRQEEEASRRRQEEERRRLEEERRLQEYIRRNQPVRVAKTNDSRDRDLVEYRGRPDGSGRRDFSRYPAVEGGRRNHGPSAPTNIDSRQYTDEARRREVARRLEEERIRERERQQQEQLRREALRREEEMRRTQSRRYEEERRRQEAARLEEARRRGRPGYEEHGRRQDTGLVPANLVSNESRRVAELERQRQEQQRRRQEAERRRIEESRAREAREREQRARVMEEQRRRQEEARLNALPVSARIIVHPVASSALPNVIQRAGFEDIDFPGVNPYRRGVQVSNFPAPTTRRPPAQSPPPCVWAVVQCCPSNNNRLVTCFESMGCPGINWDPNPCKGAIIKAARDQVMRFYAENEEEDRHL